MDVPLDLEEVEEEHGLDGVYVLPYHLHHIWII